MLAVLHQEAGGDAVAALLPASIISSVNWSEVVQKAQSRGIVTDDLAKEIGDIGVEIAPFAVEEAEAAAQLWASGADSLSLADRACLATAEVRGLEAVTADREWTALATGVAVRTIR